MSAVMIKRRRRRYSFNNNCLRDWGAKYNETNQLLYFSWLSFSMGTK
jgi:hypothetical protein